MLLGFFIGLREAGLPVSLREYLTLLEAMQADLADRKVDTFYLLARTTLVKDEAHLDRFDRVFAAVFEGVEAMSDVLAMQVLPKEWLEKLINRTFTDDEKAEIEALGGFDALMEALRERLADQRGRHQGGSKWIGTGGTSPFGHGGFNPEGVRIGGPGKHQRAAKVWEERRFADLDGDRELASRSMKLALRRLRRLSRTGRPDELDLEDTVRATADKGWLDLKMRPERRNAIRVLLLLDIGGSMDWHVRASKELFSAARSEFRSMSHLYFHNCVYETVWTENGRRRQTQKPTLELMHDLPRDTRLVIVGDASMSPYEISMPGGSVEHWNEEPGAVWLSRLLETFESAVWLNPVPERHWPHTYSIGMIREIMADRMYPLTLEGIDRAMGQLAR